MTTNNSCNFTLGASGKVLTSTGTATSPTFQPYPEGSWIFIEKKTASASATLDFTTGITSTYTTYALVLSALIPSTTSSLQIQLSNDGGSSWLATNYLSGFLNNDYNSATISNANSTTQVLVSTGTQPTSQGVSGIIYLYNITTSSQPVIRTNATYTPTAASFRAFQTFATNTATGINAFRLSYLSGNIETGKACLYGIRKS